MKYYLRIEKGNEIRESGCFDLLLSLNEHIKRLTKEYEHTYNGEFTTYNNWDLDRESFGTKLELTNFVHVWDFERVDGVVFKCLIEKK